MAAGLSRTNPFAPARPQQAPQAPVVSTPTPAPVAPTSTSAPTPSDPNAALTALLTSISNSFDSLGKGSTAAPAASTPAATPAPTLIDSNSSLSAYNTTTGQNAATAAGSSSTPASPAADATSALGGSPSSIDLSALAGLIAQNQQSDALSNAGYYDSGPSQLQKQPSQMMGRQSPAMQGLSNYGGRGGQLY